MCSILEILLDDTLPTTERFLEIFIEHVLHNCRWIPPLFSEGEQQLVMVREMDRIAFAEIDILIFGKFC